MPRIVKFTSQTHGPKIMVEGELKKACLCGISATMPWCDSSHKKTKDEDPGKLYIYEDGIRKEVVRLETIATAQQQPPAAPA